jgi:hypothetical protein
MNREQYLADLKPLLLALVIAVHDDGPEDVQTALQALATLPHPDDVDPAAAAFVVLAAAVDPDATLRQLWGWADDPNPRDVTTSCTGGAALLPFAAVLCLAGLLPFDRLDAEQQDAVITFLRNPAWTPAEITSALGADPRHVQRVANRLAYRKRRAARTLRAAPVKEAV